MKSKILAKLKEKDSYVSGQELCEALGISRTAVWKIISKLREEGYIIDAVRNKGYKILEAPDIITKSEIESLINSSYSVVYEDETDSTNNKAKLLAEKGASDKTIIIADSQTAGKGRKGKSFESKKGQGIFMSILLRPGISPTKASMITILAAAAVRCGIYNATGLECNIKWPNDIIYDGKKLCGILTEMNTEMEYINYVIAGIGINVSNEVFDKELSKVATSLKIITGKEYKRSNIIAAVTECFDKYYEEFLKVEDLSFIRADYEPYLINIGRRVKIIGVKESYEAVAIGIDNDGELIVERNGKMEKVISGEVSVRGVYGYV